MNGKLVAAVLALVLTYAAVSEGMGNELRCQCIKLHSKFIPSRSIQDVKMTPSGPPCQNTEIIATLKDGREVCLDPTAQWVKIIIQAILDKAQANAEAKR